MCLRRSAVDFSIPASCTFSVFFILLVVGATVKMNSFVNADNLENRTHFVGMSEMFI